MQEVGGQPPQKVLSLAKCKSICTGLHHKKYETSIFQIKKQFSNKTNINNRNKNYFINYQFIST